MSRTIALLLCFCVTILCSFVGYLGFVEENRVGKAQSCESVSCAEVLNSDFVSPSDLLPFELVEFQNVTFVETGNFAGNTTYTITDGANNLDVRVNSGTDLVGTAIPTGTITITGLVG